jgi:molecular chaperone HtpG
MREQFTVDLRGLVEILSHHLYRNERVYLRELVQNAHDAIQARAALGHRVDGEIEIVPARGYEQLVVRDNGIGLTADDMRSLLSIIGSTSKRSDVAAVRRQFLGQFGIGLLSCFLVADTIEVISRSARTPDAPTVRWVGESDGTFTIGPALKPLAEPGTEVRLRPRHGYHRFCDTDACTQFASEFAELLAVPVRIGDTTLSQQPRPWTLSTEEQLAWCQERFGFEAMGIIPFDTQSAGVVGLAFVLPYTAARAIAPATASTRRACWSPTPTTSSSPAGRSSAARSWTRATCRSRRRAKVSRSPASSSSCASRSGSGCSPS